MHALFWLLMNKALPHAMMLSHKCGGACRSMHSLYKARRTREETAQQIAWQGSLLSCFLSCAAEFL